MRQKKHRLDAKSLKAEVDRLNCKLPAFCTAEVTRHGKIVVYFRRRLGERKVRIRSMPLSDAFWVEYARLRDGQHVAPSEPQAEPVQPPAVSTPYTLRWLCEEYYASDEFKALKRGHVRRLVLEECCREAIAPGETLTFGDCPLAEFKTKAVQILKRRKTHWATVADESGKKRQVLCNKEAANSRVKYLRSLLAFGVSEYVDLVERNWAREVELFDPNPDGHHTWTIEEIEQFEAKHPVGTTPRLVLAMALLTLQRRGDLVRLGRQMLKNGMLVFIQEKNKDRKPVTAYVPVVPELQKIIDASPTGDLIYLVQDKGQPYTAAYLGKMFHQWCVDADLSHCSLHGLRKAGVVRLIALDCSPFEIMSISGHRTMKEIERYGREFRRETAARALFDKWMAKHRAAAADAEDKIRRFGVAYPD